MTSPSTSVLAEFAEEEQHTGTDEQDPSHAAAVEEHGREPAAAHQHDRQGAEEQPGDERDQLARIFSRITNEVAEVNRVVLDVTSIPPAPSERE